MCSTLGDAFSTYRALRARLGSRSRVEKAVKGGSIFRVRRGVYADPGACVAAIAAVAHGGALHCLSAARHAGLWVLAADSRVHVGMRAGDHQYAHGGDCDCVVHWDDRPTADAFGLPSLPRILRQILFCCGVEEFFVALESAMHQRRISRKGLAWLGSHTNARGREALHHARWDAESGLESLVRWRLRSYRLRVRTQVRIDGVGRVDLVIGERLILETDGKDNHNEPSHRHKDLVRDANAAARGYVTLRFDYALVVHDWPLVERAILASLAAGRHL